MRQAYKVAFNLNQSKTDNMTFNDAYKYSDSIFSQRFELDIPQKVKWTDNQIAMINTTQIWGLLEGYTPLARKLAMSFIMDTPMNNLQKLVDTNDLELELKKMGQFELYSMHDFQVANMLQQIVPSYNFTYIPYASNIFLETYKIKGKDDNNIFVKTVYNG